MWAARDKHDNSLILFTQCKPVLYSNEKGKEYWEAEDMYAIGYSIPIPSHLLPELTFENSPMEVELKIKQ